MTKKYSNQKIHTIGMLVEDQPGVMAKISGLFSRRGFNIETITVGKIGMPGIAKMIFTVLGDEKILEQLEKQVNKLVDVVKVSEFNENESVINELALIKVSVSNEKAKHELIKYSEIYKVKIIDITQKSIIFRIIGEIKKIDSFIEIVKSYGIKEISRTGVTAMGRGPKSIGGLKTKNGNDNN